MPNMSNEVDFLMPSDARMSFIYEDIAGYSSPCTNWQVFLREHTNTRKFSTPINNFFFAVVENSLYNHIRDVVDVTLEDCDDTVGYALYSQTFGGGACSSRKGFVQELKKVLPVHACRWNQFDAKEDIIVIRWRGNIVKAKSYEDARSAIDAIDHTDTADIFRVKYERWADGGTMHIYYSKVVAGVLEEGSLCHKTSFKTVTELKVKSVEYLLNMFKDSISPSGG